MYEGSDDDDQDKDKPPASSVSGTGGAVERASSVTGTGGTVGRPVVSGSTVSDMVAEAVVIQHDLQRLAATNLQKLLKAERQAKKTAEAREKSFADYVTSTPAADFETNFDEKEIDSDEEEEEVAPKKKTDA